MSRTPLRFREGVVEALRFLSYGLKSFTSPQRLSMFVLDTLRTLLKLCSFEVGNCQSQAVQVGKVHVSYSMPVLVCLCVCLH